MLYANKKHCDSEGVDFKEVKRSWTIDECGQQCKGVSSIFMLGTNDYRDNENKKKCFDDGCICRCAIFASVTGTCELRDNLGFRVYKYIARGSFYEFQLFYSPLYDSNILLKTPLMSTFLYCRYAAAHNEKSRYSST